MNNASILVSRLESLGLNVLSASLESYLSDPARRDETLLESISSFIDIEYCIRKERSAKTRIKVSGMPGVKRLEDYDISWLKGGLTTAKFKELCKRKINPILK